MGGEKVCAGLGMRKTMGSPPRWRGKDEIDIVVQVPSGITPALAGKSRMGSAFALVYKDHPRVGGEKRRLTECAQWAEGSPPRWRGKVYIFPTFWGVERITPALAGKSTAGLACAFVARDHPRVGGEKYTIRSCQTEHGGSPPRGRGKAAWQTCFQQGGRITPAWAGKRKPYRLK